LIGCGFQKCVDAIRDPIPACSLPILPIFIARFPFPMVLERNSPFATAYIKLFTHCHRLEQGQRIDRRCGTPAQDQRRQYELEFITAIARGCHTQRLEVSIIDQMQAELD